MLLDFFERLQGCIRMCEVVDMLEQFPLQLKRLRLLNLFLALRDLQLRLRLNGEFLRKYLVPKMRQILCHKYCRLLDFFLNFLSSRLRFMPPVKSMFGPCLR